MIICYSTLFVFSYLLLIINIDNLITFLTVLISLFNFLTILYIFASNRRFEIEKILFEKKATWFRDIILKPNIASINDFYLNCDKEIINGIGDIKSIIHNKGTYIEVNRRIETIINSINNNILNLNNNIITLIESVNYNFSQLLYQKLDEIQDDLFPKLESLSFNHNQDSKIFTEILHYNKNEFIGILYNYEIVELFQPLN